MAVNLNIPSPSQIHPVAGISIGTAAAGIRQPDHDDVTVFRLSENTQVAGVFTRNQFCAAPVQVSKTHLAAGTDVRALVINTGNANAGTGEAGLQAAQRTCAEVAQLLGIRPQQVLPFSTGVILEPLPVDKLIAALPQATSALGNNNWLPAAHSIMTTDTQPKITSQQLELGTETVAITGISKGAGMIRPNMATMLGFLATDAGMCTELLQDTIRHVVERSFNRITVDGDTSTNDAFILMATGESRVQIQSVADPRYAPLLEALTAAALDLAQKIVRDAEGATKFITIRVSQAKDSAEALRVAYAVAHSPLVKTAFYASDPNLGRILCAIGYADVPDLDVTSVRLSLGDALVAANGQRHPSYTDAHGEQIMQEEEITMHIELGRGEASETIWTSDLSHDYVTINAEYRT